MKFKTVAEAFNYYRNFTLEALENRAQEIRNSIDTDANVDVAALNIELTGIAEAKKNIADHKNENRAQGMNVITGQNTGKAKTFNADTVCDTPEYRNAFYKNMLGQKLNQDETNAWNVAREAMEKRADAYTTSTDSGRRSGILTI